MKPSSRRRVEREIQAFIKSDGDRCSLCHADLPHNSRTYGGITSAGASALVGQCCRKMLGETILSGLYVKQDHFDLPRGVGHGAASPQHVEEALAGMQAIFEQRSEVRTSVARRAGLDPAHAVISNGKSDWKTDDMRWFQVNADRLHRLRRLIGDEAVTFGTIANEPMPNGHELQVLVRQIEPGQRIRMPFGRNVDVPIPDDEQTLHALFDVVAARGGPAVSTAEVLRTMADRRPPEGKAN